MAKVVQNNPGAKFSRDCLLKLALLVATGVANPSIDWLDSRDAAVR